MNGRLQNSLGKMKAFASPVDQVLSSVSNGLILFALAVSATVNEFGIISLLFTLTAAAIGLLRGALGTPLLLAAGDGDRAITRHGQHAVGAALMISLLGLPALLASGIVLGHVLDGALLALALPVVLMQDTLRYCAIAIGRPHLAAVWDGFWCLGSLGLLILAWGHVPWVSPTTLIACWMVSAAIALVGLALSLSVGPSFAGTWRWLCVNGRDRLRYGVDAGLEQVTFFIVLLIGAVFVGHVATAAMRGATAALAPLAILASSVPLLVIPAAVRSGKAPQAIWRTLGKVAALTSLCAAAAGAVLYTVPETIGSRLLGASYEAAREVVPFVAMEYAMTGWIFVLGVYLRSQNRSSEVVRLRTFGMCATLGAALLGAVVVGTPQGIAASYFFATVVVASVAIAWFTPWRPEPWRLGVAAPTRRRRRPAEVAVPEDWENGMTSADAVEEREPAGMSCEPRRPQMFDQ